MIYFFLKLFQYLFFLIYFSFICQCKYVPKVISTNRQKSTKSNKKDSFVPFKKSKDSILYNDSNLISNKSINQKINKNKNKAVKAPETENKPKLPNVLKKITVEKSKKKLNKEIKQSSIKKEGNDISIPIIKTEKQLNFKKKTNNAKKSNLTDKDINLINKQILKNNKNNKNNQEIIYKNTEPLQIYSLINKNKISLEPNLQNKLTSVISLTSFPQSSSIKESTEKITINKKKLSDPKNNLNLYKYFDKNSALNKQLKRTINITNIQKFEENCDKYFSSYNAKIKLYKLVYSDPPQNINKYQSIESNDLNSLDSNSSLYRKLNKILPNNQISQKELDEILDELLVYLENSTKKTKKQNQVKTNNFDLGYKIFNYIISNSTDTKLINKKFLESYMTSFNLSIKVKNHLSQIFLANNQLKNTLEDYLIVNKKNILDDMLKKQQNIALLKKAISEFKKQHSEIN